MSEQKAILTFEDHGIRYVIEMPSGPNNDELGQKMKALMLAAGFHPNSVNEVFHE
jgi:hypothetical protein